METTFEKSKTLHLLRDRGLRLFYENGYYNTSLNDILRDLSITKAVFEHYFQTKEDFFISITQNLIFQDILNLLIPPVNYKRNPFPILMDLFDNELEKVLNSSNNYGFMLANFINEFNNRNKKISKYLLDILQVWEINLISILKKGQLDGYLDQHIDCESVANHIISSYFGVRTLLVEGNASVLRQNYLGQLKQYFDSISCPELSNGHQVYR
ncbi:hypothetical protein MTsPCn5_32270 [Croceitalea sp. MTPC5]|uniref:TetR/AcrR family transcriptional regulator n=1 Tax=Croceitalea sp. MTPC5 TaxID=3056565 RepID=UPI002B3D8590|nr:hypothetical protein MTsPCn5_32270 [Croceitalea sp. MTPC5]